MTMVAVICADLDGRAQRCSTRHGDTVAALIDATPLHLRNTNLAAKIKAMVAPTATHLPGERI